MRIQEAETMPFAAPMLLVFMWVHAPQKTQEVLGELKIHLPDDPEVPLVGLHPGALKAGFQGDVCTLKLTA